MPLQSNVKIAVLRGLLANLPATTGQAGVLAWTTDSHELYVDDGTAFQKLASDIAVFNVANPTALTALSAKIGDVAVSASDGKTYILTGFPASTAANWVPIATSNNGAPVQGLASGVAHEWVSYIDAAGVQHLTQPSFADISGTLSQTQLPASIGAGSNLTLIDCGTF